MHLVSEHWNITNLKEFFYLVLALGKGTMEIKHNVAMNNDPDSQIGSRSA